MGNVIDMTGWVMSDHGVPDSRLTVVKRVENDKHGKAQWLCECSCPQHNKVIVIGAHLRNGNTKSCGCMHTEQLIINNQEIKKRYNRYDLSGEYGIVYTSNQEQGVFDIQDYDLIKDLCWYLTPRGYLIAWNPNSGTNIFMHRLIMGVTDGRVVDHINHITTDNRKENLRICEQSENNMNSGVSKLNSSGIIGVCTDKLTGKWKAQIVYHKNVIYLGLYQHKRDAIIARLKAEHKYFGEFAPQKHLYEKYGITIQNDCGVSV